ncbi:hypothetical protein FQA39_LY01904 [Lamprigera yunnana]|nr:hypothetical protein FQA39_LY01904 [Lamprigera yunnana]
MSSTHTQEVRKLYKIILRLNKGLPEELKALGTEYVRSEFKRHKKCSTNEARIFMEEWSNYAVTICEQLGLKGPKTAKPLGCELREKDLYNFRNEQLHQLHQLKNAATSVNLGTKIEIKK